MLSSGAGPGTWDNLNDFKVILDLANEFSLLLGVKCLVDIFQLR